MISTRQTSKTENNKLRNDILDELASLKKNNRDLARSLAEKSKENVNLREIENKYHIIETKFKMNREQRMSSISNLEVHFTQTCSLLSNVVKNLSILHDTLRKDRKVLCLTTEMKETERNTALDDEETTLLKETYSLRHVPHLLSRLCTTYSPVSLGITINPCYRNNEDQTIIEKEFSDGRHLTLARNKSVIEEDEMGIRNSYNEGHTNAEKSFMNSKNANRSYSKKNYFRNIVHNDENIRYQTLCPVDKKESFSETTTSSVSSNPVKNGDSQFLNEDYRPLKEKQSVYSAENETFHFSQDEAFQNFSADDETIIRKGADVFFSLGEDSSHSAHQVNTTKSALCSQIQGDHIYLDEFIESKEENMQNKSNNTVQLNFSKYFVDVLSINHTNNIENVNCNELRLNRSSTKCEITQSFQETVSEPWGLDSVTSALLDKSNLFSVEESDAFNYSRSLVKKDQTFHNPKSIYNKSIRKSGDCKLRVLSSNVEFQNYTPELFPLLRQNCMLTLNLQTSSAQLVEDESHLGKENYFNADPKREFRQTKARKSRKPFLNKQKEMCSINQNEIKSFENENVCSPLQRHTRLKESNLLKISEKLKSQKDDTSEKSRFSKTDSTKNKKGSCVKKKNLRL